MTTVAIYLNEKGLHEDRDTVFGPLLLEKFLHFVKYSFNIFHALVLVNLIDFKSVLVFLILILCFIKVIIVELWYLETLFLAWLGSSWVSKTIAELNFSFVYMKLDVMYSLRRFCDFTAAKSLDCETLDSIYLREMLLKLVNTSNWYSDSFWTSIIASQLLNRKS